ncbi:S8 family serine peptidase [Streptomyces sp. NPDC056821]|uniref:S8 family serine peptidase n=1 Tax=unclassified Streptomyces TaxID=2593676 RepID=UPI00367376E2
MPRAHLTGRWRTGPVLALVVALMVALLATLGTQQADATDKIDSDLAAALQKDPATPFWIRFDEKADLSAARSAKGREKQGRNVIDALRGTARDQQSGVLAKLKKSGAEYRTFWASNTVYVARGSAELAKSLAEDGNVVRLRSDHVYKLPDTTEGAKVKAVAAADDAEPVEWGVDAIGADDAWSEFGSRGEGVVIGSIDSGAQHDHPALRDSYRGTRSDGSYDHNYNWFDPSGVCGSPSLAPCDNAGHGTHTIGTMTGGLAGSARIGVAPGAKWISAKGCEGRTCSESALLASAQWMLAPTDLSGNNPRPELRPDIINNSWGNDNGIAVEDWYQDSVKAWIAAGIFPVFANGNAGPACNTAGSPGDYAISYAVGAFDSKGVIASFSSRGQGENGAIKPDIAAPGVSIRSAVPGNSYAYMNGTSMAAPHTAGAVALLWSAAPALAGDITATRELLDSTAVDVNDTSCGGTAGNNNVWGEGKLDALAAITAAPREGTGIVTGKVTDAATGEPVVGAELHINDRRLNTDADGGYRLRLQAGEYTVAVTAFGYQDVQRTVTAVADRTVTENIALKAAPTTTIHGKVSDASGHGWGLYAKISAVGVTAAGPWFSDPATGAYEITLPATARYTLRVDAQSAGYRSLTRKVPFTADDTVDLALAVVTERCVAPGYSVGGLFEPFDSSEKPKGWTVVQHADGGGWEFDDPTPLGNRTPKGSGNFASVNSEFYGYQRTQDSDLITPAVDLTQVDKPVLQFETQYQGPSWTRSVATIDLSTDDGTTWTQLWTRQKSNLVASLSLPLPQAAGHDKVRVRFNYKGSFDQWWMIDDVLVGDPACAAVDGGLLVGQVKDGNTGGPVAAATVTAPGAGDARSVPTTEDPKTGDGLYTAFLPAGTHQVSAGHDRYASAEKTVTVHKDQVSSADFTLQAGRLDVKQSSLDPTVRLGSSTGETLTLTNTGKAPLTVRTGLSGDGLATTATGSGGQAEPAQPKAATKAAKVTKAAGAADDSAASARAVPGGKPVSGFLSVDTAGRAAAGPQPTLTPDTSGAGNGDWATLAPYPSGIMDPATGMYRGEIYTAGGYDGSGTTAKAYRYDPVAQNWTALAPMNTARQAGASAFIGGKFIVTGGWSAGVRELPSTEIYDPGKNTWTQAATLPKAYGGMSRAVLQGKLYVIGGCVDNGTLQGDCGRTDVQVYDPQKDRWGTAADYPVPVSWSSCGALAGKLYCAGGIDVRTGIRTDAFVYDPAYDHWSRIADVPAGTWAASYYTGGGKLLVTGGIGDDGRTTAKGFAYDPAGNAWSPLPDTKYPLYRAGSTCGLTVVGGAGKGWPGMPRVQNLTGYDDCGAADLGWASAGKDTVTLKPGERTTLPVHLDTSRLTQPGAYSAAVQLRTDSPYASLSIPLNAQVTPPPGWAKVTVDVEQAACTGGSEPLKGAYLEIGGSSTPLARKSDRDGETTVWLPVEGQNDRITVIASKDGLSSATDVATVKRSGSAHITLTLKPAGGCPGQ